MYNENFTHEDICNFNFYNSSVAYFDVDYVAEDELNIKLNKKAATTSFDVLKFSKSRKIAMFKDKNKVYYTTLQSCNCSQYEKEDCCVHIFRLAQMLNVIDSETGILLIPQEYIEEFPFEEPKKEVIQKKEKPSTVGIGKRCKHCNAVIDYDKTICPSCNNNPDKVVISSNEDNSLTICFVFVLAIIFFLLLGLIL